MPLRQLLLHHIGYWHTPTAPEADSLAGVNLNMFLVTRVWKAIHFFSDVYEVCHSDVVAKSSEVSMAQGWITQGSSPCKGRG